jgi:hypothetical protein
MSSNLDLVRSIYADWARGDFTRRDWADAEIEFVVPDGPTPGRWRGLAQAVAVFLDSLTAWDGYRIEADSYRELDDERVLVLAHFTARSKASGIEVGHEPGQVWMQGAGLFHIQGDKVTKLVSYNDADRALADLSLEG